MTKLPHSYRELKKKDPEYARECLLRTLKETKNISQTARLWSCSRNTVKLAIKKEREGNLKDDSRAPHSVWNKSSSEVEERVAKHRKETGYGKRRIARDLGLPEGTARNILSRLKIPTKKYRSFSGKRRKSYDLEKIAPFEELQMDVKEILDKKGLPKEIYQYFQRVKLPLYQWTCIDVKTRIRFLALSFSNSWTCGRVFIATIIWWLRTFGILARIHIQHDGGKEFSALQEKSFKRAQKYFFDLLGVTRSLIRKGHAEDNAYVERSHRTDDEEFYTLKGLEMKTLKKMLELLSEWIIRYNIKRRHQGLNDLTPLEYLKSIKPEIHPAIALFPPLILDSLETLPLFQTQNIPTYKIDQNVVDYYQVAKIKREFYFLIYERIFFYKMRFEPMFLTGSLAVFIS